MDANRDTRTELRLQVLRNGYTPLPNVDKLCQLPGWPTVEVDEATIRRWARIRGENGEDIEATGIRLENGLCALDFDVDHPAVEGLYEALLDEFPTLVGALMRRGKGYKEAWFVRTKEPFHRIAGPLMSHPDSEEGMRVEVYGGSTHRQFGAFGWHTRGELEYSWVEGASPANVPITDLPEFTEIEIMDIVDFSTDWMDKNGFEIVTEEGSGKTEPSHVWDLTEEMVFVTMEDGEVDLDHLRNNAGSGYYYCSASFIDGRVARNTRRCSVTIDHDGGVCIWDSMTGISHHEASKEPRLVPSDEEAAEVAAGLQALGLGVQEETVEVDHGWRAHGYLLTEAGGVRQIEANMQLWIERQGYKFSYSDFDGGMYVMEPLPGDDPRLSYPRSIRDADITKVALEAQRDIFPAASPAKIWTAMQAVADENRHHPVRDHLDSLVWDGEPRLNTIGQTYLGTSGDLSIYEETVLRKWLISAVARIYQPGCKADHVLILEGAQGCGKSTFVSLLGGAWYGDDLPPLTTKDAKDWLRRHWIVELAELSAMSGREVEHVKAFITARVDSYRPSYGRATETVPRQCVFAGTTNDGEYLQDTTGGRRFWPVSVGKIDLEAFARDRDQILAEAVAAYKAGEVWHLDPVRDAAAISSTLTAQERVRTKHLEEIPIARWLREQKDGVYTYDIAVGALGYDEGRIPDRLRHVIPRIIKALGWVKGAKKEHGIVWVRGPGAEPYKVVDMTGLMPAERAARGWRDGRKSPNTPENGADDDRDGSPET